MKRVLVALSGGVDSSVAATLLKREGCLVEAGYMKLFPNQKGEERARIIAERLEIPFHLFDFQREFKEEIIDSFISAHKMGRTPNPCIECNHKFKFGLFVDRALEEGFDFVATGHYLIKDGLKLYRGRDREKDQSYFLWRIDRIEKLLFPLGNYKKEEVKRLAEVPHEDSMDICFVKKSLREYLLDEIGEEIGDIVKDGVVVGQHKGSWLYTIGQRKGLSLSGGPYFITKKENNRIEISREFPKTNRISIKDINWLIEEPPLPLRCQVQLRSSHKAVPARVYSSEVVFDSPQRVTAPGQSAVFYNGEQLLGGGIVES